MGVVTNKSEALREIEQTFGLVPTCVKAMPEHALASYWTLMRDIELAETKIPSKYKELIGIALSGATRCRYCQLFHTELAKLRGATDEEIAEACAMAGVTMAVSTYLNALGEDYDRFRDETLRAVQHIKNMQANMAGAAPGGEPRPEVRASV